MRRLMLRCLAGGLLGLAMLTVPCGAEYKQPAIHVTLETVNAGRIGYAIENTQADRPVTILSAAYDQRGKMLQVHGRKTSLPTGVTREEQMFTVDAHSYRVFLLDGQTGTPLCEVGRPYVCNFLDWDGTLLSSQNMLPGQKPKMPEPPEWPGYVFTGWDQPVAGVTGDTIYNARYVPDDHLNIFRIKPASCAVGDTVTVTLELTGTVRLYGFDMELGYDPDALEFVGMNTRKDLFVVANHKQKEHRILFNYMINQSPTRPNLTRTATVMELTFRVRDGAAPNTVLRLHAKSVAASNPANIEDVQPVEYALTEGVICVP